MKRKVIAYNRVEKPVLRDLQEKYDVHYFKNIDTRKDREFLRQLQTAEGIIGLDLTVDQELLNQAPQLKIVSNNSVGYNNLDIEQLTKRNIMATNTPGILTDTVADLVFGLLIATARRIPELDAYVKKGNWQASLESDYFGSDVHHKTLGIIGMGRIGEAIAKRAHFGFDMDILYHTRSKKAHAEEVYGARYRTLDQLLMESDFVCIMTPLTPETHHYIGKREFQLMKPSAIFVNGSRGKTVVEQDLIAALQSGEIAAAAVDVFEQEPTDPNNPLLKLKNVVTLPHIGSSTTETELNMSRHAADNLEAGINGDRPPSLLNPEVLTK
jgi:gluconate 2-dehydrogenase